MVKAPRAVAKKKADPIESQMAKVVSVQDDIVTIEAAQTADGPGRLVKNEVVYILPTRLAEGGRQERLKAEVLRVRGNRADAQVFESTRGVAIGDCVEQSGQLLSVQLGPGLLGQLYDGLQNPLEGLAQQHGTFLPRGVEIDALDNTKKWAFTAHAKATDTVRAGDVLGSVKERHLEHKIMLPFDIEGKAHLIWIQEGNFTIAEPIAEVETRDGERRVVSLQQSWPVRRPLPLALMRAGASERLYPDEPLITTLRLIDTFFPIARGGVACIPGPFGAGKTVLQNLISRYSDVDVVIIVACGERAGEVVETIKEFPNLSDPKTGGSLMDRTVIICNTSSMPVAAREASIYTGITISEYYRQMGLDVLLLADSTSRWAQAMRETSGRLEEIPGEEAFPAYLDSAIKSVYERAGVVRTNDQSIGSLTMIGTVSPAGGNFEEPVTQSTLSTVKTFLGLSAERAYKRFYPSVDPLLSWSRYLEQLSPWYEKNLQPGWSAKVREMVQLLNRGNGVFQMMQVTGEEGVTIDDFVIHQKSTLVDMVYLQQDAYDQVDVSTSILRQEKSFALIYQLVTRDYVFVDKADAQDHFIRLTGQLKNLNYAILDSVEYKDLMKQIVKIDQNVPEVPMALQTES
jgi:V/A-type H+-transporting ATPase subunit A